LRKQLNVGYLFGDLIVMKALHLAVGKRPGDGRPKLVLAIPERFRGAEPIPDDVVGVVLELSSLGVPQTASSRRLLVYDLCKRYGVLSTPEIFRDFHGGEVRGELLARWTREGKLFYRAIYLLQLAGLLELPLSSLPLWASLRVGRTYESAEKRREGARELAALVNRGLRRSSSGPGFVLVGEDFPLRQEPVSDTLLGRLWQRVAAAANARTKIALCENCGKILVPTGERKRETMRSDRKWCSGTCRWQHWNKRTKGRAIEDKSQSKEGQNAASKKRA